MLHSEMVDLKKGDQVRYIGADRAYGVWPRKGEIITRAPGWLDDDHSLKFTWQDEYGNTDWHFFGADEIEFI